jgi:putative two-component system response regulator
MDQPASVGRPRVLVIDNSPEICALLQAMLDDLYDVKVANSGRDALELLCWPPTPDLILLDVMMPGMDGYQVCREIKSKLEFANVPVLFVTAKSETAGEQMGFAVGGVDYIIKPFSMQIIRARVQTHLSLKAATDALRYQTLHLEEEVAKRIRELMIVQDVTVMALAKLAEVRKAESPNYARRTQHYVRAIARKLSEHPNYAPELSVKFIDTLFRATPLHDIGKVGIPDRILLKPGKLTPEELDIMKTHVTLGRDALEAAQLALGSEAEFLTVAKEVTYSHQEKWDGSGYPKGIRGTAIPLSARLVSVALVYNALISRRVYREPLPHDQALEILKLSRGKHFDPDVVDAFMAIQENIQAITVALPDTEEDFIRKIKFTTAAGV